MQIYAVIEKTDLRVVGQFQIQLTDYPEAASLCEMHQLGFLGSMVTACATDRPQEADRKGGDHESPGLRSHGVVDLSKEGLLLQTLFNLVKFLSFAFGHRKFRLFHTTQRAADRRTAHRGSIAQCIGISQSL
jgi:hypothetical protein